MALTYRTTSDLPFLSTPAFDSYFQVSQPVATTDDSQTTRYSSMKVPFRGILSAAVEQSIIEARREFQILSGTSMSADVITPLDNILSGEATLIGQKTFEMRPTVVSSDLSATGNSLATFDDVENIVRDTSFCFSASSVTTASPDNSAGYTKDDGNLLMWNIDSGQRDSSLFRKPDGSIAGYISCDSTGILVMYGWLADNGNLNPEECWVGVFAEIENADGTKRPTLLQMQPWIVGKNSQTMQYVGFSIPVRKGLGLKVMTGFNVNGDNSGFGNANSLMTSSAGSMVNTFVGYIVK